MEELSTKFRTANEELISSLRYSDDDGDKKVVETLLKSTENFYRDRDRDNNILHYAKVQLGLAKYLDLTTWS